MDLDTAASMIEAYGLEVSRPRLVSSAADAAEAAALVGYPVVLDGRGAHGDAPPHELRSLPELAARWDRLLARRGPAILPMAILAAGPRSVAQVHVTSHAQLGPVLRVVPPGCGGEPIRCVLPMDRQVLDDLVDEVVCEPSATIDPEALREVLLSVSALVLDNPELIEAHLDLVDAATRPASVLGVHLRGAPTPGLWDDEIRHLRRDT